MRPLSLGPIHSYWYPYKRKQFGHRVMRDASQRKDLVRTQSEGGHPQSASQGERPLKDLDLPTFDLGLLPSRNLRKYTVV